MKKLYLLFMLVLCANMPGNAQDSCSAGIIHYWKMNENSTYLIDKINGLIAIADTSIQRVLGIVDSAQSFKGATKVNIPSDTIFDWKSKSSFTIEFWMKKTTSCIDQTIKPNNVIIGRDDQATKLHWWGGVSCQNDGKFEFDLYDKTGKGTILVSKKTVTDGKWHHIVIVRNGNNNTTTIYIDGAKDISTTFVYNNDFVSTTDINIGWLNLQPRYFYDGILDELAIYNIAIADSIITGHYNSGKGEPYCEKEDQTPTSVTDGKTDESGSFVVYPTWVSSDLHVKFSLAETQNVRITVYDLTGKMMKELYNNTLNSGEQNITFNSLKEVLNQPDHAFLIIQLKLKDKEVTRKIFLGN